MGSDMTALENDLVAWVAKWNEQEVDVVVVADTDLQGTGLLDSMALVALVAYLEDQTDTSFDFESFDSSGSVSIRGLIKHCVG
ncbi:phosphopantetheine-binding protein [Streptosporangium sp. NPDC051023]|uniref:phosphopantetheine-binding protein n=1 Tax=Streptosporangium sp. NPDC051023 TaxID=3155410 RepID=UPI00344B2BD9